MKTIFPYLWFDSNAEEAVTFYTSIFKNSSVGDMLKYDEVSAVPSGMPVGSILTIAFTLEGQPFAALNGGPIFKFTPATSFFVSCKDAAEVESYWNKLIEGGSVLMELQKYPFSEKYGWLQDKYGVSWQIGVGEAKQKIRPSLLFVKEMSGKAEEAMDFYVSMFPNSSVGTKSRYGKEMPQSEGKLNYGEMVLNGYHMVVMDSDMDHKFGFSQAISFDVSCDTQEEIDHFYDGLSEGGEKQPCGWVIDKFGVAWQVEPVVLYSMLMDKDPVKAKRAMTQMLKMQKLDIEPIQKAYEGK